MFVTAYVGLFGQIANLYLCLRRTVRCRQHVLFAIVPHQQWQESYGSFSSSGSANSFWTSVENWCMNLIRRLHRYKPCCRRGLGLLYDSFSSQISGMWHSVIPKKGMLKREAPRVCMPPLEWLRKADMYCFWVFSGRLGQQQHATRIWVWVPPNRIRTWTTRNQ